MKISEGCPKHCRSMSNENIEGVCPMKISEGGPTLLSEYVQ